MAYKSLLISFSLVICMSSIAHCSLLDGNIIDRNTIKDLTGIDMVGISGIVRCQFPSVLRNDDPPTPAGLNVVLSCDGDRKTISDAVTDANGFFEMTFNTLQTSLFHPDQCDDCRIVVKGTFIGCRLVPGRRGALIAPIDCRNPTVEQLHGDKQGHGHDLRYKAKTFYYDPSY